MLFLDFEVFQYDWLVVIFDMARQEEYVIINDPAKLAEIYEANKHDIWVGYNIAHYDQWIFKAILCDLDPKKANDHIIIEGKPGWTFAKALSRQYPMNIYDVMSRADPGLKGLEGFMGNNIKETSVPFNINRKLTDPELEQTVGYCRHDVEQTIEVFLRRKEDFEAHLGLVKIICGEGNLNLSLLSETKAQLSAVLLEAVRRNYKDEFEIDFPDTLQIRKYTQVVDWYKDPANRCYTRMVPGKKKPQKTQLEIMIAGCPHQFGWGGIHGALEKYYGEGYYLMADVASLYPSLMLRYGLLSRSMRDPKKFEDVYHTRLKLKAEGNPLQLPLKLVLNSTYGVMKDPNNDLYDPRQANRVCVYGQLLILDLIEKLEPHCQLIQSNTDGILIKMQKPDDYYLIDDICAEWENRTGLTLEFDEYKRVYQKDVNNYMIIPHGDLYTDEGKPRWKSKGAYVKKLGALDYDLPIVNKAICDYMISGIPVEQTIMNCQDLKEFQLVSKISTKYDCILHGNKPVKEKCVRIFASKNSSDAGMKKVHATTKKAAKLQNSPEHCFIFNEEVNGVRCPSKLDKQWYVNLANKRLQDFGVIS